MRQGLELFLAPQEGLFPQVVGGPPFLLSFLRGELRLMPLLTSFCSSWLSVHWSSLWGSPCENKAYLHKT